MIKKMAMLELPKLSHLAETVLRILVFNINFIEPRNGKMSFSLLLKLNVEDLLSLVVKTVRQKVKNLLLNTNRLIVFEGPYYFADLV
jgi:hypothetical protein